MSYSEKLAKVPRFHHTPGFWHLWYLPH